MIVPLLKGLAFTLKQFFSRPITIQYPEEKRPPAKRWRGIQYFERDEEGRPKCVACGLCMAVCPSQCISIVTAEDPEGRRYPLSYELDALRCIFCGYCEEACPVNAIFVGKNYEWVERSRAPFLMNTERLLEEKRNNL
ncbi:MAG: NADH-quinone oxidoreductase subunit NuoI [Desulfobacterota bacterium]|nr:NADH-quinone oxidoreductase subunit NuoI [Thermodesulfobacteriota bacterium]